MGLVGLVGLAGLSAALACATYTDKNRTMRARLDAADYDGAVDAANDVLKVRDEEKLPRKWKKDTGLALLERATVLHALGAYELSARDFQAAEQELELLDISVDAGGNIARWVYSESAAKYRTPPSERLALNAINLENYLIRGDLQGARVEAKRFTVMRDYLLDHDPEHAHGEFGSYMAGFVFEKLGARDEALRYYDEALQQRDFASLREPIARLSETPGGFSSERIDAYKATGRGSQTTPTPAPAPAPSGEREKPEGEGRSPQSPPAPDDAIPGDGGDISGEAPAKEPDAKTPSDASVEGEAESDPQVVAIMGPGATADDGSTEVLVVIKLGRVPHKEPVRIPIGAAIGLGAAYVTGDTTLLEQGMLKFIVYPELVASTDLYDGARVMIDGKEIGVELATDTGREVVREYEELKPRVIGAALSRMIARAAASAGMQAAGSAAASKNSENSGLVGALFFLGALAAEGTLVALDKPDTRSWTTLPSRVYIARARVPAGSHKVVITTEGPGSPLRKEVDVQIEPGGFAAIDFTTLR